MSTTDVHRMIDNKLPPGRVCSAVSMVEVYTAIIDGAEVSIDAPLLNGGYSMSPEAVADLIVAQVGSTDNAAEEGGEVDLPAVPGPSPSTTETAPMPAFFRDEPAPPLDYDDGSDEEDDEPLFEEPDEPAPKKKPKKKAKAKRR